MSQGQLGKDEGPAGRAWEARTQILLLGGQTLSRLGRGPGVTHRLRFEVADTASRAPICAGWGVGGGVKPCDPIGRRMKTEPGT